MKKSCGLLKSTGDPWEDIHPFGEHDGAVRGGCRFQADASFFDLNAHRGRRRARQPSLRCLVAFLVMWLVPCDVASTQGVLAQEVPAQKTASQVADARETTRPLVLAHYMPWYVATPPRQVWGWHWTMDHFDPEQVTDGRREIASHYYPLIGPYDSGDPHVIEYHLLLMKLAGIDGVIVDWYGLSDYRDYAVLHENTRVLVQQSIRLGMKFVICYEDQTIPALVAANRLRPEERVAHAQREIGWLQEHWFAHENYVRHEQRPVLLSFGHAGLANEEWSQCLDGLPNPVAYFSEHFRRAGAAGGFDWPVPKEGLAAVERFEKASRDWSSSIPVVFPRFLDIYAEANLHDGYGHVDDKSGQTFRSTFARALDMQQPMIQIATWNDWGEGTQIEPSVEFGYRDLEAVQSLRRIHMDRHFASEAEDLRLPGRLLQRRRSATTPEQQERLAKIAGMLSSGQIAEARRQLQTLSDVE